MTWMTQALEGEMEPNLVTSLVDPQALHLVAINHNWSSDTQVPRRLSEHPQLDRGTALLLFWLTEPPEVALGMENVDEEEPGHKLHDLIDALRSRLVEDRFQHRAIAVDLRADLGYNRLFVERLRRAGVPPSLWEPSPGDPFDEEAVVARLEEEVGRTSRRAWHWQRLFRKGSGEADDPE